MVRRLGNVPWDDLEGTLNLGIGMVAVVDESIAEAAIEVSRAVGIEACVLGSVHKADEYEVTGRVVSGTKGVQGGAVDIHGVYRI